MSNGLSKTCKVTAIILLVLCIIVCVFMIFSNGWYMGIPYLVAGFFAFLPLYALGSIIEQLLMQNNLINGLSSQIIELKKSVISPPSAREIGASVGASVGAPSPSSPTYFQKLNASSPSVSDPESDWVCTKCDTRNQHRALYCKNCGSYR